MSYASESVLKRSAKLVQVEELIALLGYRKVDDGLKIPSRVGSYFWADNEDYRSYVGVELDLYRSPRGQIKVGTRSRLGRSYWDLIHQNKTLKAIRDLFGGHFTTDAGRNRYWRPDEKPPSPLASGCFIARWRFHNALGKARIYLMSRKFEGDVAREKPSGLIFMDEMNPRILSNNFLLPYIVAIWEDYFRSTFAAALVYSSKREVALKRVRIDHGDLEKVVSKLQPIERAIAESFSFQHPKLVVENFKFLDSKLDLGSALRKPYRRRKMSLFDSIEILVQDRNIFVHTGRVNVKFFDPQLDVALSDIEVAVNRCYEYIARHYGFIASHDY
jgi:hypothetical protein